MRDLDRVTGPMKPPPITLSGTVPTISDIDHEAVAAELEDRSAHAAMEWMFENFGAEHYIACSFQKTSSVTAHIASQINSDECAASIRPPRFRRCGVAVPIRA